MELRHLRYFVVVAEEEHMTRAAQRLNIRQPPLSSQIRDLEREMEVQLFDRTPRSIRLNAAGRVFLKEARELLANVDRAVMRTQQAGRGEFGRIAVGYTSSASLHPKVPQLIRVFHEKYPMVALDSHENTTRDLLDAVVDESLDAVFVRSTTQRYPMLKSVVICEEPMVVALPAGHRLAQDTGPMALSALRDEDFIVYRRADGPGIRDVLFPAFRTAGFTPRVVADVPRLLSAVTLVAAGKGITLVPETLRALHRESIKFRELDVQSGLVVPLTLVYRDGPEDTPLSRFVSMASREADQ